jgi:dienelactone hydrolase
MYDVNVETVQYPTLDGKTDTLSLDIFYPSEREAGKLLPAVILVNGFPNNPKFNKRTLSNYQSWGRLIALEGLIAVTYDTNNENDLEAVIKYIQENGSDFGIDSNKLGFWSCSSHSGLASNFAFQEGREYLKFAVFYYPWIMTPDNFERVMEDASCKRHGCLGSQLPDVKQLRTDLPLLVVRSGRDGPHSLAIVDHFAELAKEAGVPLTLLRFDQGVHGFDFLSATPPGENMDKAIEIIKQTLAFMKQHAYDQ